jgi:hypothetical protein
MSKEDIMTMPEGVTPELKKSSTMKERIRKPAKIHFKRGADREAMIESSEKVKRQYKVINLNQDFRRLNFPKDFNGLTQPEIISIDQRISSFKKKR